MPANASDIILHNYPLSPVAEKVRTVLDIKGLIQFRPSPVVSFKSS